MSGDVPEGVAGDIVARDPWHVLSQVTTARVGLGRAGAHLPTTTQLELAAAHAAARDAVHASWDIDSFAASGPAALMPASIVRSQVGDRAEYLRRPDLGRALRPESEVALAALRVQRGASDVVIIVSDGLSALAVDRHAAALVAALGASLGAGGARLRLAPLVCVRYGRVALSDAIGQAMGARLALMIIGERPGLSATDSVGLYLTFDPRAGRSDADRNCISNVRPPAGMDYAAASELACWLVRESLARGLSGVALKDTRASLAAVSERP